MKFLSFAIVLLLVVAVVRSHEEAIETATTPAKTTTPPKVCPKNYSLPKCMGDQVLVYEKQADGCEYPRCSPGPPTKKPVCTAPPTLKCAAGQKQIVKKDKNGCDTHECVKA
ncbi:hypothetical protein PPL_04254 [Heterostelium album PN500]|uniref:Uncharacterized protein n=1 Tax=Heterostelium pallidum (strain ATCC 26659 / Pp 5 / PN500) TaxID=670386 RepID=D3B722_HETP5|nr:hypothetical protein PPL_04254 [Heterostelium album PN500]EFA82565.1 hypothetical protein PPL_04254 [Heterostelium album PN500]|eukprot:XP_020434682.1 hypothetical protein PPL_04254 [Heterostelium album PN500]